MSSVLTEGIERKTELGLDVTIVVPTFREAENLKVLVPRVTSALREAGLEFEMVIVDDNSRDGTVEVCAELATDYPVRLLVRENERGLSSAVIHGMRNAQGRMIVVMDADLSHPPERVPELVRVGSQPDVDFVIGSRYVSGGSVEESWGLFRWLNSKVATLMARPFTSATDPMAGFFAIKREKFVAAQELDPIGYKIGLELIVKCACREVREIPIHFSNRLHGTSKLSLKEQINYIRHLKRLAEFKVGHSAIPVQFAIVGATGVVVDLGLFTLLKVWMLVSVSRALAIWGAMTWNWWLNRRLTFSYSRTNSALPQYLGFCLSCLAGALVNFGVSLLLIRQSDFLATYPQLAALVGVVAGTVFNYLICSRFVFGKDPQRNRS